MNWTKLYQTLDSLFDTEACLDKIRAIWENDRWFSRDKNDLTAQYCADVMRGAGLEQVELLPLKADGETKYFDWKIPQAWDAEAATLCYADGEPIADYQEMPCSLVMYSPATPEDGTEAEVVEVCKDDIASEKYRGKVLLVKEAVASWTGFAAEVGAVGILSDITRLFPGVRDSRDDLYDECMWMGMGSGRNGSAFGFHLTPRQADRMRQKLGSGPVRVRAKVSAHSYDGFSYTVSGALVGTEPSLPEVLIYGHLYEPGANDNASGAGAILYLAQLLGSAVREGILPRPRRTVRFIVGDECGGSMGYLACHPERKWLCGIVADMIGTEAGDNAIMSLRYDPVSNWSFADAALFALVDIARQHSGEFPTEDEYIDMGTDNIIADPCFGVPTVALVASPALSYHSSMDRPDRIEPATQRRNTLIAGTYLFGLADADPETCAFLAEQIRIQTDARIRAAVHPRQKQQLLEAKQRALHTLGRLCPADSGAEPDFSAGAMPDYALEKGSRVPQRIILGALTFIGTYNDKKFRAAWNGELMISTNWVDGKRTLWQIAWQSAVEKGKCTDAELREEFEMLADFFELLAQNGYLRWL